MKVNDRVWGDLARLTEPCIFVHLGRHPRASCLVLLGNGGVAPFLGHVCLEKHEGEGKNCGAGVDHTLRMYSRRLQGSFNPCHGWFKVLRWKESLPGNVAMAELLDQ